MLRNYIITLPTLIMWMVVKLVLDALGRQLKDSGGWFLRYVVRGALGGANLVAGWTSAFQMTVVLNTVAPTVGAGVSAGFALVYWIVLHVVGRKLFFAQSRLPAVDKEHQVKQAPAAELKLEQLTADLKNISGRPIEFADLRQSAFCADWSDDEVKLVLEKAARFAPTAPAHMISTVCNCAWLILPLCASRADESNGGDEVSAVVKELEACADAAARQLRLSAFDKAEKEKSELQKQETELENRISTLDESRDAAEIAAVSFHAQLRLAVSHSWLSSRATSRCGSGFAMLCCAAPSCWVVNVAQSSGGWFG